MDDTVKQTLMEVLQHHTETFLHHTESQWQIKLIPTEPIHKDLFYRLLKTMRQSTDLHETAPVEYLEVRPMGAPMEDMLALHLETREHIQYYCLNDRPHEGALWKKRSTFARERLPQMYTTGQESIVQSWEPLAPERHSEAVAHLKTLKQFRYVVQYIYTYKKSPYQYVLETRKITPESKATMVLANLPSLSETYHLSVVWRNTEAKAALKGSYLELARPLYRHSMHLMQWLQNEPMLMTVDQQQTIMKSYGALIRPSRFIPRGQEDDSARFFLAPKPITLERPHLIAPGKVYCTTSILEHYAVTEKADGERMLLFIDEEGKAYLINNVPRPIATGLRCTERAYFHSLLDGEYVKKEERYGKPTPTLDLFAVFDIYFVGGKSVAGEPLIREGASTGSHSSRVEWMDKVCQGSRWVSEPGTTLELRVKKHRTGKGGTSAAFFKECATLLREAKQKKTWYAIDGLVFTPTRLPVLGYYPNTKVEFSYNMRWDRVYKWKPAELNTIDFLITQGRRIPNPLRDGVVYREFILKTGFNVDLMMDLDVPKALRLLYHANYRKQLHYGEGVYVPHEFRPFSYYEDGVHRAWLPEDANGMVRAANGDVIHPEMIVEFAYDRTDDRGVSYRWRPLRVRDDKTRLYRVVDADGNKTLSKTANDATTANSIWRSIHRPVTQAMIEGAETVGEEEAPGCVEDRLNADDDVYYAREIPRFHLLSKNMMNYHHFFIKSKLFAYPKIRNASLLELACGRAGDLKNWCQQRFGWVVGVDHSKDNILDPKEGAYARTIQTLVRKEQDVLARKIDARFAFVPPVVYAVGDCSKPLRDGSAALARDNAESADVLRFVFDKKFPSRHPLYEIVPKLRGRAENGFDMVSCQFALHYFLESRETLDGFFQNVSDHLKTGGYFIATFMDGTRVDALLKGKDKVEGVVHDTVLWAILRSYEEGAFSQTRPYGNRIRVYMENIHQLIPEYLVHFEFLVEFAATKGLRLVESKTFGETFQEERHRPQSKSNQRLLEEFEKDAPEIRQFSNLNRWVVFQKD